MTSYQTGMGRDGLNRTTRDKRSCKSMGLILSEVELNDSASTAKATAKSLENLE